MTCFHVRCDVLGIWQLIEKENHEPMPITDRTSSIHLKTITKDTNVNAYTYY